MLLSCPPALLPRPPVSRAHLSRARPSRASSVRAPPCAVALLESGRKDGLHRRVFSSLLWATRSPTHAGALAQALRVEASGTRLVDAPALVPSSAYPDVFFFRESGRAQEQLRTFFLDPELELTTRLKNWIARLRQRHVGFNRQGDDSSLSLFLSGAPKTGKSLLLTKVIPALLREDEMFGVGQAAEARVWHVDTTLFDRRNGAAGFLCSLLDQLILLADRHGIREVAHFQMGPRAYCTVTAELQDFVLRLPRNRPTFILLDEVQNFFLLEKDVVGADGFTQSVLDDGEIVTMRRAFKPLIGSSPLHCIWVLTGSKMALFWANIALCPVNGYALLTHIPSVCLPTEVPDAVKLLAWEVLRREFPDAALPRELLCMSPRHHATLVYFCSEWLRLDSPLDAASFCRETFSSKILPELLEDYRVYVRSLSAGSRKIMLELLNSAAGVSYEELPLGVVAGLKSDLVKLNPLGLEVYLNSPLVSYAIQALVGGDGELLAGSHSSGTMLSLCDRDIMVTFGEALKVTDASIQELLEEMAQCLETCFWKSEWFQEVLEDNLQQRDARLAKAYAKASMQDLQPWEHLRFYLRMWRCCAIHAEAKRLGLTHQFVKTFPSSLWAFVRSGKVQAATSTLLLVKSKEEVFRSFPR